MWTRILVIAGAWLGVDALFCIAWWRIKRDRRAKEPK